MNEVYEELKSQCVFYGDLVAFLKYEITNTIKIKSLATLNNTLKRIHQLFNIFDIRNIEKNSSLIANKRKLKYKRTNCSFKSSKCRSEVLSRFGKTYKTMDLRKIYYKNAKKLPKSLLKIQEKRNECRDLDKINMLSKNSCILENKDVIIRPPKAYALTFDVSKRRNTAETVYPIFHSYDPLIGHKDADRIRKQDKQILIVENIFNQGNQSVKTICLSMLKIWAIEKELKNIMSYVNMLEKTLKDDQDIYGCLDFDRLANNSNDNLKLITTKESHFKNISHFCASIKIIRTCHCYLWKYVTFLNDRRNCDRILLYLRRRDTRRSLMKIIEMERRNIRKDVVLICRSQLRE